MKFSKYMVRILLFGLLLETIPVASIGFFSYYQASSTVQSKVIESNEQVLLQTQMRIEKMLETVDNMLTVFINSSESNKLLQQELNPNQFELINSIEQNLHNLQVYDFGIKNIIFFNHNKQWVLQNEGLFRFDQYSNQDQLMSYLKRPQNSGWTSDEHNAYLIKKLPINSNDPEGLLIAEVPLTELQSLLMQNKEFGNMFILNSNQQVIATDETASDKSYFTREVDAAQLAASSLLSDNLQSQSGQNQIIYRKSNYSGWTYLSIVPLKEINRDSAKIGWLTLYICLFIYFITLLITLFASNRLYRPVGKLYAIFSGTEQANSKKRPDELKFIHDSVQALLEKQTLMDGRMKKQMDHLKELFIIRLCRGELPPLEIADHWNDFYRPSLENERYGVMIMQIDSLAETNYREKDTDLLLFAINNIVNEMISEEHRLAPVIIDRSQVTIFRCTETEDKPEAYLKLWIEMAEEAQRTIKDVLQLNVSIGISKPYPAVHDISVAYNEAAEALKHKIRLDKEAIIYIDDIYASTKTHLKYKFPDQSVNELIDAIKLGDPTTSGQLLKQILKSILVDNYYQYDYHLPLVHLFISLVRELPSTESGAELQTDVPNSHLEQLYNLKTMTEIEDWFGDRIIGPLTEAWEKVNRRRSRNISDEIIHMIHEKYETDLSLTTCAEQLHYHPSYIKHVFRKEVGVTFSEYLLTYRLNIAKKWLIETDMKIAEIAVRLQYNNSQNFIRSFKKQFGITPGQFRNENGSYPESD